MSSLVEKYYDLPSVSSSADRQEQLLSFFASELNQEYQLIKDENNTFWFDENKTAGFKVSGSSIIIVDGIGNTKTLFSPSNASSYKLYYQVSVDSDVIYISINEGKAVAARDESGRWGIFIPNNSVLMCDAGTIYITLTTVVDAKAPFTLIKMPSLIGNYMFKSLYKIISAPSYTANGMLIAINNKPFRVVGNAQYPSFAFPVSD